MILGAITGGMKATGREIPRRADGAGTQGSSASDAGATNATSASTPTPHAAG